MAGMALIRRDRDRVEIPLLTLHTERRRFDGKAFSSHWRPRRHRRPTSSGLLAALHRRGYQVVGPTVRDGAIVYDELDSTTDLPIGWTDEQDGGIYRLKKRPQSGAFWLCCRPPHSWKKYLLPPTLRLPSAGVEAVLKSCRSRRHH